MQVLLRVNATGRPEKKIKVSRDVLIGREKGQCDLRVASNEVSRQHCRLLVMENSVAVRDLGSANGTRVNGERVPPKTKFPVNSGDVVGIGPLEIHVDFRPAKVTSSAAPTATSLPVETEDEFLSEHDALAALDAPVHDLEQSAAVFLIESRLVDSDDDYESNVETIDAAEREAKDAETPQEAFDTTPSTESQAHQQFSPLEADSEAGSVPFEGEPEPVLYLDPAPPEPAPDTESSGEAALAETVQEPAPAGSDSIPEGDGDKKPGRLKSLFSRKGRKKAKDAGTEESDPAPPAESVPEAVPVLEAAEAVEVEAELVPLEDAGSIDRPAVEPAELMPAGELEELVPLEESDEVEEYEDDGYVEEDEPADEGFADFLNQFEEPQ